MSEVSLTKSETAILTEAAGRQDGMIVLPDTMKESTARRLTGRLLKHDLIAARELDGNTAHHLTLAGYQSVGMEPPDVRPKKASGSKRERVLNMLRREEGASIEELMSATGWLPHTTRAVLSRLRSAGEPILKSKRQDGPAVHRIVPEEPTRVAGKRVRPSKRAESAAAQ